MSEAETTARAQLRVIAATLEAVHFQLLGVHSILPVSPLEALMLAGEQEMDAATDLRSCIECVLNDYLWLAIREIRKLVEPKAQPGAGP